MKQKIAIDNTSADKKKDFFCFSFSRNSEEEESIEKKKK